MSRTRFTWYRHVQNEILKNIRSGKTPETMQEKIACEAIEAALVEIEQTMKNAGERLKLIDLVYRKQTHTVAGAALKLHISERTASDWSSLFVYMVGENMGFTKPGSIDKRKGKNQKFATGVPEN